MATSRANLFFDDLGLNDTDVRRNMHKTPIPLIRQCWALLKFVLPARPVPVVSVVVLTSYKYDVMCN